MADVLIASDAPWVVDAIRACLDEASTVRVVHAGVDVRPAVAARTPDLVVVDLQVGNMGGMAVCMDLRLEESAGRLDDVPVLMLLDRRPDVFMAKRAGADGWLLKPVDPIRMRRAVQALLAGGVYHDDTGTPATSPAAEALAAAGGGDTEVE
ncbi:MAG TPA: response regulator [Acidimicrobiales bacterium]|nr:response regulator [Acidimicrobiales bacterium]